MNPKIGWSELVPLQGSKTGWLWMFSILYDILHEFNDQYKRSLICKKACFGQLYIYSTTNTFGMLPERLHITFLSVVFLQTIWTWTIASEIIAGGFFMVCSNTLKCSRKTKSFLFFFFLSYIEKDLVASQQMLANRVLSVLI